ncbi:MAG: tetratricopeptide repeat protein [Nitrospirae bacterium]|nr:tetratricopeptide repeat protein [Nitrospirota bacterium]
MRADSDSDSKRAVSALIFQADRLAQEAKYQEAYKLYKRALQRIKVSSPERLTCLMSLADTERIMGAFNDAIKHYSEAIAICQRRCAHPPLGHPTRRRRYEKEAVDAEIGLALAKRALGLWKEALVSIAKAKQHYIDTGDKAGCAFSRWAEAGTLRIKGDIGGCIEGFKQAMELFTRSGDNSGVGYSLCGLGGAHRIEGSYEASFDYYSRANRLFSSLNDRFGIAYSYCGMGNALRMKNIYKEGEDYLIKALSLYNKIGDIVSSAYTLWSLGILYTVTGRYDMADSFFDKAQQRFTTTSDVRGTVYVLLGRCQLGCLSNNSADNAGLLDEALRYAKQYDFAVERCHCLKVSAILNGVTTDCYQQIGITSPGEALPLNIP